MKNKNVNLTNPIKNENVHTNITPNINTVISFPLQNSPPELNKTNTPSYQNNSENFHFRNNKDPKLFTNQEYCQEEETYPSNNQKNILFDSPDSIYNFCSNNCLNDNCAHKFWLQHLYKSVRLF